MIGRTEIKQENLAEEAKKYRRIELGRFPVYDNTFSQTTPIGTAFLHFTKPKSGERRKLNLFVNIKNPENKREKLAGYTIPLPLPTISLLNGIILEGGPTRKMPYHKWAAWGVN